MIWPGIIEFATAEDINIITYIATSQDQISSLDLHYSVVQGFINNSNLDGVIVLTGAMGEHTETEDIINFCHSIAPTPIVAIALHVPEIPTILVENSRGILDLMDHFVTVHNYKRIAFIKGPDGHDEAEERFNAYLSGLKQNGIERDDSLIIPGDFSDTAGEEAVQKLIADDIKFDAILAADDETAMGAMEELKKNNLNIPGDVAIAGFDDVTEASLVHPSLSTVRQPLYKQGAMAVKTLLEIIDGSSNKKDVLLPTESVYRRSCGCFPQTVLGAGSNKDNNENFEENEINEFIYKSISANFTILRNEKNRYTPKEYVELIISRFKEDVKHPSLDNKFLNTLDQFITTLTYTKKESGIIYDLLTSISSVLSSMFGQSSEVLEANNLLQKARALVSEHVLRQTQSNNMAVATQQLRIRETSQRLITTFELNRILHVIAEEFPKLDIENLYLALYPQDKIPIIISEWEHPKYSSLLMAINGDEVNIPSAPDEITFESYQLFPQDIFKETDHKNLIFMPLFFRNEHFGFIVFKHAESAPFFMYEELRLHLSSALKSSFMLNELKTQSLRDELTGIFNRRGFIELGKRLVQSVAGKDVSLWMFYIDLDGLKIINDTYGHDEGDLAIAATAEILTDTFRKQDIIGRIGGDEYTVVLASETHIDTEKVLRERLNDKIEQYNSKVDKPYKLSMSVGVSQFGFRGVDAFEQVMKEADDILLAHKKQNKKGRDYLK
jgi:diguanylate cyclase (GGDEF)-like protein